MGLSGGDGQFVIPAEYDAVGDFIPGKNVAFANKDGKILLLDRSGNTVLETVFSDVIGFCPDTMVCVMEYTAEDGAKNAALPRSLCPDKTVSASSLYFSLPKAAPGTQGFRAPAESIKKVRCFSRRSDVHWMHHQCPIEASSHIAGLAAWRMSFQFKFLPSLQWMSFHSLSGSRNLMSRSRSNYCKTCL